MDGDGSLKLTDKEIASAFADPLYAQRFPPVPPSSRPRSAPDPHANRLSMAVAGPAWLLLSQGRKHLRFYRDRLLKKIFNEGLTDDE